MALHRLWVSVAMAVAAVGYGAAFAQSATPMVDQRAPVQQQRIEQGVSSGALNAREAHRLERGQRRVETMEGRAKADGQVTTRERARLHRAQDRQSRRIAVQNHDRQHH